MRIDGLLRCARNDAGWRSKDRRVGKAQRAHQSRGLLRTDGGYGARAPLPTLRRSRKSTGRSTIEMLPQPQLIIPLCRHLVASGAIRRRAAAVAGDDTGLLALDVGIDAGHPGIDLV